MHFCMLTQFVFLKAKKKNKKPILVELYLLFHVQLHPLYILNIKWNDMVVHTYNTMLSNHTKE